MDLHKHILLCVCRFQTHCLTQSLRLSCNELEWDQMRGEESELLGHSSTSNLHFYFRGFWLGFWYTTCFPSCKTHNMIVQSLILLHLSDLCCCFHFQAVELIVNLLQKRKKEEKNCLNGWFIPVSFHFSGWLTAQCTRIKCGQSYIHAVTPIHSSLQHTLAGNPHLMTELPGYWLMEAPSFFLPFFILTLQGKYYLTAAKKPWSVHDDFMLASWHIEWAAAKKCGQ